MPTEAALGFTNSPELYCKNPTKQTGGRNCRAALAQLYVLRSTDAPDPRHWSTSPYRARSRIERTWFRYVFATLRQILMSGIFQEKLGLDAELLGRQCLHPTDCHFAERRRLKPGQQAKLESQQSISFAEFQPNERQRSPDSKRYTFANSRRRTHPPPSSP